MTSMRTSILVTGTGSGGVGEGVVKGLKMNQQKYRIIAADMNPMSATLLRVDKGYVLPEAEDRNYLRTLLNVCEKEKIAAIIPGSVPELKRLSEARSVFAKKGISLIIGSKKVIDICIDKWQSYNFLSKFGFSHPKTVLGEEHQIAANKLGFPLFVKPREGYGSRHIYMAHDEEELLIIAKYLDKIGVKFIIQEYVKAQECTIGVVVSKSYRVMGSISVLREVRSGFSYRMVVKDIKEARDISERIALKLGVTGPLNVQLFITDEGPVIFEMNPRFSGTTPIRSAVGFNEVDGVLRNFLYGEEIQLSFRPNITAIRYLDEVYAYSSTLDELQREGCTEKKGWRKNYF